MMVLNQAATANNNSNITCRSSRKIMVGTRGIYWTGAALLIMSTFLMTTIIPTVSANKEITGTRENCENEGEEVPLTKDFDNCFKCICRNGFVECEPEQCPSVEDCYYLEKRKPGVCCERCKECHFNGTSYSSGSEWTDAEDPCLSYKCVAGVVTEVNLQCYTPCSYPSAPKPDSGQCCPTCVGCKYNGQIVLEGREVTSSEDPCLKCQCKNRRLECVKKACPVSHCPLSKQIKMPGECCPRCSDKREVAYPIGGRCILGKGFHKNHVKFTPDHCTTCTCQNGTSHCRRDTCPVLECPREMQTQEQDDCCPKCPPVSELQSVCVYNGTTYQHDETWNMDTCRSCRCVNGRPHCAETKCPELKCRPSETKTIPPGQCCAKCEENAGICTVFGDPHYKTFDGKFFSFQGSCKYQLTADCHGHTFSIRVTNDVRSTKSSSWTKTVTLKVGNLKVNLGQKMRVKVNGTRIQLPYVLHSETDANLLDSPDAVVHSGDKEYNGFRPVSRNSSFIPSTAMTTMPPIADLDNVAELDIRMTEDGISVLTKIGIKLLWDGTNFLQVQAPVTYKRRLCGLCGNYNSVSRDDFKSRRGTNMNETSVWQFANSWRVGGTKSCMRNNENFGRHSVCKHKKKWIYCKRLQDTDSIFGNCRNHLNSANYVDSCKKDMCECETDLCFCDSFAAYAHECKRIGYPVTADWRQKTGCTLRAVATSSNRRNAWTKPTRVSGTRNGILNRHKLNEHNAYVPDIPDFFPTSTRPSRKPRRHKKLRDKDSLSNMIEKRRKGTTGVSARQRQRTPPPIY